MCVIIFVGEQGVHAHWQSGFDITAQSHGSDDDIHFLEANSIGVGKMYPYGPTCCFRGVDVPTLCLATPHGGITSETLKLILKSWDELGVTQRGPGLMSHLQVDGHGSRFELSFLQYVCDPMTAWSVNQRIFRSLRVLDVPYLPCTLARCMERCAHPQNGRDSYHLY